MKKLLCLLLTAALILSCAACGSQQATAPAPEAAATDVPSVPEDAPTPRPAGPFSPEGSVIFEKDGVKVTTAGLDYDPTYFEAMPIVWIEMENAGSQDAYVGVTGGSVNGVMADVHVNDYYLEDGEYCGGSEEFGATVPAGETVRRALGYTAQNAPGVRMDTLGELAFYFTLSPVEWTAPAYISEPVVIVSGEDFEKPDVAALGSVVLDSDVMTLALGEQDYDDWFGPLVYVSSKTNPTASSAFFRRAPRRTALSAITCSAASASRPERWLQG